MENDENIYYVGDREVLGSGIAKYFIDSILLANKGTTRVHISEVYGPLISTFSIVSSELYDDSTFVL